MTSAKRIEEMAANPEREYNDVPPVRFKEKDDFDREIIADNIIKLLDSDLTDCYPMAIDGGWGTGKSEFCHKLINKMRDNAANYKTRNVIYFDAFEAENIEEPLLSLLAKITEVVPESERKSVVSKIAPVALYTGKVIAKGLLSHLFRQNGDELIDGFSNALHEEAQKGLDESIDGLLKQYAQAKNNIEALRTAIQTALGEKELVIFIDELDRCRPDFALNVFELVKHVFDIEGVKFIFVFNSEQIKSMIKNRYGSDVDTETYIEKFIKLSIVLPQVLSEYRENIASLRLYKLKMNKLQKAHLKNEGSFIHELVSEFIKNKNVSLRGVEKFCMYINIYTSLVPDGSVSSPRYRFAWTLYSFIGILIFTFDKTLAQKILGNTSTPEDYFKFFNIKHQKIKSSELSCCQTVCEVLALDFQEKIQNSSEIKDEFFQEIKEIRNRMFEGYYPHNGLVSLIKDPIKTLNFCG